MRFTFLGTPPLIALEQVEEAERIVVVPFVVAPVAGEPSHAFQHQGPCPRRLRARPARRVLGDPILVFGPDLVRLIEVMHRFHDHRLQAEKIADRRRGARKSD